MKKKGKAAMGARLSALCMAALMAVSMLPAQIASAAETSFGKIAEEQDFTTGRYVMVTDTGYAPQKIDGTWLPADELGTALGDTVSAPADETVWEIAVTADTATIKDMDGKFLVPKGGMKTEFVFPLQSISGNGNALTESSHSAVREMTRLSWQATEAVRTSSGLTRLQR